MKNQRILVAPLNWGMGHATRMIPLIDWLLSRGNHVVIGSDGSALKKLQETFPGIQTEEIPGYNIQYNERNLALDILIQLPKILAGYRKERKTVEFLQKKHQFDIIISDNRYGALSSQSKNYFVTHQTQIQAPLFQGIVNFFNKRAIAKFDECWVPDFDNSILSGKLSSKTPSIKTRWIGPLSRFHSSKQTHSISLEYLIMISGPEPKRSNFERKIVEQISNKTDGKIGVISNLDYDSNQNLITYKNPNDELFFNLVSSCKNLITRPGYSTIMDLLYVSPKLIFVPTKGQTEQEYLGKYYKEKFNAQVIAENQVASQFTEAKYLNLPQHIKGHDVLAHLSIVLG